MSERNGPEFAPLKEYVKSFPIVVVIFDKDDNEIRTVKMDYGKYQDRIWLGKLSFWGWTEGYTVETFADNGAK